MNTISKLSTVGFFAILSLSACGPYEDYPAQETVAKGGASGTSNNSTGGKTSPASSLATSTGGNVGATGGATASTGGNVGTGGTSSTGTETSPTVKADAGVNADTAPDVSIAPDSAPTGSCKEGEKTTIKVSSQGKTCDVTSECTNGKLVTTLGSCSYVSDASTGSDVLPPAPDSQVLIADTAPVILGLDGGTPDAQAPAIDSQPAVDTQPALDTGSLDTQVSPDAQVFGADALVSSDTQPSVDSQQLNCGTVLNGESIACMTFDKDGANSINGFKICTNGSFSRCWVPGRVVINCSVTTPTVGLVEVTGDIIDNLKENKDNCPAGLVQDDVKNVYPSGDFNGWIKTVGTAQKYFAGVTTYAFSIPIANKVNRVTFIGETAKGDVWSWNPSLLYEAGSNNKCSWSSANNTMFTP